MVAPRPIPMPLDSLPAYRGPQDFMILALHGNKQEWTCRVYAIHPIVALFQGCMLAAKQGINITEAHVYDAQRDEVMSYANRDGIEEDGIYLNGEPLF